MSRLKNFFLFCSGVDHSILEKCPTDVNKYTGIGGTVFFTGVLAFFSSGYALYTVFDSYILAAVFGLVWGMMIFNLDRYIVMSMKSIGSWWRDWLVAAPRLALAVLLAIVISKPLELKIFEKEINAELVQMEQEVFKNQEDLVKIRYQTEVEAQRTEIARLKKEMDDLAAKRDTLTKMALAEADGSGGSKIRNMGPIYKAKKADADRAQAELDTLMAINLPLIVEKENAIKEIETAAKADITNLERTAYGGMAARIDALSRLTERSQAIFFASIFIMLLFVAIETSPIFVKLISYRSPYDYVLHEHEHVYEMANLEKTTMLGNHIKNKVMHDTEVGTHAIKARITEEKAVINKNLKEKLDALGQGGIDWKVGT